ncbi:hypothetical protein D3C78_1472690 [compost metagenome]
MLHLGLRLALLLLQLTRPPHERQRRRPAVVGQQRVGHPLQLPAQLVDPQPRIEQLLPQLLAAIFGLLETVKVHLVGAVVEQRALHRHHAAAAGLASGTEAV